MSLIPIFSLPLVVIFLFGAVVVLGCADVTPQSDTDLSDPIVDPVQVELANSHTTVMAIGEPAKLASCLAATALITAGNPLDPLASTSEIENYTEVLCSE